MFARPGVQASDVRTGSAVSSQLPIAENAIAAFCRRHRIRKFSLFGSVLRDDFGPESDVDVTAEFEPGVRFTLFDLVDMQEELSAIMGRRADLHEFRGFRPWMQQEVARSMKVLYESKD